MLADSPRGGGKGIVHDDGFERILEAMLLVEFKEARNVHVQRAAVFARRKRQLFADAGGTAMRHDVILEFVAEMTQGGEDGIRRGLAKSTKRAFTNVAAEFVEKLEVMHGARAFGDAVENAQRFVETDTARNTFSAGLGVGELDEVAGDIDHAVVFIHDHHAAGTHDGAEPGKALVVHGGVKHFLRECSRPMGRRFAPL